MRLTMEPAAQETRGCEQVGPTYLEPFAISLAGVEQTKHCKEEPKEEKVVKPESVLIKRRLSAQGQAISVVGSLSSMSTLEEEAPQAKRRPEPIIPVTQPR